MEIQTLDDEYCLIVKDILNDRDFVNLKEQIHHGINRYDHSLRVSYQSYLYAKKRNLDYKAIAVGGLLHDFFENEEKRNLFNTVKSFFVHPNQALNNATTKYELSKIEQDIIKAHMFPVNIKIPKYKESWVVSFYDKKIAIQEFIYTFNYKVQLSSNILILLLFNLIK